MSKDLTAEWPWAVLGLQPTKDEATIKSAYAAALKRIGADPDVATFQALREARDAAIAGARDDEILFPRWQDTPFPDEVLANLSPKEVQPVAAPRQGNSPVSLFDDLDPPGTDGDGDEFEALNALLAGPWARTNLASWQSVLADTPLLSDEKAFAFERSIVSALDQWLDKETLPDHEVFLLLDDHFAWSENGSNLELHLTWERRKRLMTIIYSLRQAP